MPSTREDKKRLDEACSQLKKAVKSKDTSRIIAEEEELRRMLDTLDPAGNSGQGTF